MPTINHNIFETIAENKADKVLTTVMRTTLINNYACASEHIDCIVDDGLIGWFMAHQHGKTINGNKYNQT